MERAALPGANDASSEPAGCSSGLALFAAMALHLMYTRPRPRFDAGQPSPARTSSFSKAKHRTYACLDVSQCNNDTPDDVHQDQSTQTSWY